MIVVWSVFHVVQFTYIDDLEELTVAIIRVDDGVIMIL